MEVFLFHVKLKMKLYKQVKDILELVYSGSNLNLVMNQYKGIEDEPRLKYLVYGVIRYNFALEYIIRKLSKHPNDKVQIILFIGIFELWFSNKPNYAVVNDLVEFTKESFENPKIASFVNAILRTFQRDKDLLLSELDKDYSTKFNLPNWFIDKLKISDKPNYLSILSGLSYHPAFGIRVNQRKINLIDYVNKLANANIKYEFINNKLVLSEACAVEKLPGFFDGEVSVQDIGAQYVVDILTRNNINPKFVLDACSAPGGKACQILENYDCDLLAVDIAHERLAKVKQNLERLNLSAELIVGDATNQKWNKDHQMFDLVIADVPCSATGTIKRNPDIKLTRKLSDIDNFVTQQREIINNLWSNVSNDGYLMYITCSVLRDENQDNVTWIKANLADSLIIEELQILPSLHNDGLFYALIKKHNG